MNAAVGCGRTDESGEACALIEKDDASTPQVRTNDNLLNIDKTPLLAAFLGTLSCAVGNGSTRRRFLSKSQAVSSGFSLRMVDCLLTRDLLLYHPSLEGRDKGCCARRIEPSNSQINLLSEAHAEPPRCPRGEDWRSAERCVRLKKSTFRRSTAAIFKPSSTPYPTQMAQAARTRPHPTTAGSHGGV